MGWLEKLLGIKSDTDTPKSVPPGPTAQSSLPAAGTTAPQAKSGESKNKHAGAAQPGSKATPKNVQQALNLIAACKNKRIDTLKLTGLKLTQLPPEISSLTHLKNLHLNDNQLRDDSLSALVALAGLTTLSLDKNKIGSKGADALASLKSLSTLTLRANGLGDEGAQALATLRSLRTLDLHNNNIGDAGAKALAQLTGLRSLILSGNVIGDDGATALSQLTSLKTLSLEDNRLGADGAKALGSLTALTSLNLSGNRVGPQGAEGLSRLTNLSKLFLSRSGIDTLSFTRDMKVLRSVHLHGIRLRSSEPEFWTRQTLDAAYVSDAQIGDVPPELLSKAVGDSCLKRLRAHFAAQAEEENQPKVIIRDVKVMLLGNGRVGKTQMRRRLKGEAFNPKEPATHGVEIISVDLPPAADASPGSESTPLKIWDFGGQDIYLGTHALFLKTRAVFPILWTEKSEENETYELEEQQFRNYPLMEWVHFVLRLAGPNSPLLLVQAQCETPQSRRRPPVPEYLKNAFAFPPIELRYNAEPWQCHERLLADLREATAWLAADGRDAISARWAAVKADIEARAQTEKRITRAAFDKICTARKVNNLQQREVLLGLLNDFGTVFHDPELFPDLILDQNWALRAIYALFDRRAGAYRTLLSGWGRFTRGDLGRLIWDSEEYAVGEQEVFIAMMLACKVAFLLRPATKTDEALYIAPDLLPQRFEVAADIAARFDEEHPDAARDIEFSFAVPSLLRELMVEWGSTAGQHGLYWRDGLWFYDAETKSHALIDVARPEERSWRAIIHILVQTRNGDAVALLERLVARTLEVGVRFGAQVEDEHDTDLRGLPVDDQEVEPENSNQLESRITPAAPPLEQEQCFISYKRGEDDSDASRARAMAFDAVKAQIKTLGLDPYYDVKELRHGESISGFIRSASKSPKFVLIISAGYFGSSFCMEELLRIWRECKTDAETFRERVRTVYLPDAAFMTTEERIQRADQWQGSRNRVEAQIAALHAEQRTVPPLLNDACNTAILLNTEGVEILECIADSICYRVDEIGQLTFQRLVQ